MAYIGKESKKQWIYVYVQLIHFTVHKKITEEYYEQSRIHYVKTIQV